MRRCANRAERMAYGRDLSPRPTGDHQRPGEHKHESKGRRRVSQVSTRHWQSSAPPLTEHGKPEEPNVSEDKDAAGAHGQREPDRDGDECRALRAHARQLAR